MRTRAQPPRQRLRLPYELRLALVFQVFILLGSLAMGLGTWAVDLKGLAALQAAAGAYAALTLFYLFTAFLVWIGGL